jgi:hypothetical protein
LPKDQAANITPEFIEKFVKEVDVKLSNNSIAQKITGLESKVNSLL